GGRRMLSLRMRRDSRQDERVTENARKGQRGGAKDRNLEAEVRGEESGDSGTDEETDSEGDADERERTRTLLRRRDVGDVRLRDGEITRGDPVDGAGEEADREIRRGGEDEETGEGPELADEQDRLAAEPNGKRAK